MKVAVVVSGFPRRSETFAIQELAALDRAGLLAGIFALKPGDGETPQPGAAGLTFRVQTLTSGEPAQQAAELVDRIGHARLAAVHGYFAHAPATVAQLAAARFGVPFGFSAHARDIRKVAPTDLRRRVSEAACLVVCNTDAAEEIERAGRRPSLVPHGVDLMRFQPTWPREGERLEVLAVGRLVDKKGFHVLLEAVRALHLPFHLRIVGDGPQRERLQTTIDEHHLGGVVHLHGPATHVELPALYAAADLVVVPSVLDSHGDRDGVPNVLLEAMASWRPVVASDVGAIRSVVRDGVSGTLVPPGDVAALAAAIGRLGRDPVDRRRLAVGGRAYVERERRLDSCTRRLQSVLESAYG